jgi:L-amino acid N-acyltransferase YncA
MLIRKAEERDLPSITEIYNDAVLTTTATFDLEPKTVAERLPWFNAHGGRYSVLLAETDGIVLGWASLSRWSDRKAYDGTAELSLYVDKSFRGKGIGNSLMEAAIAAARVSDFHTILSRITEGNEASLALHAKFGFEETGRMREVGKKFGRYLDVQILQLMLD